MVQHYFPHTLNIIDTSLWLQAIIAHLHLCYLFLQEPVLLQFSCRGPANLSA